MFDELPELPSIEGFENLTIDTSNGKSTSEAIQEHKASDIGKVPKFERRILTERERLIDNLYGELLSAVSRTSVPENLTQRTVLYNLLKNDFVFREGKWDLFKDYGLSVYIGTLPIDSNSLGRLAAEMILDLTFGNYENRDVMSIFPQFVDPNKVFLKTLEADRREIVYRSRVGLNYVKDLSIRLHELCGRILDSYFDSGFFESVPDELIKKQFEVPGWTIDRVIRLADEGYNKVDFFQLVELIIRLGHLVTPIDGEIAKPIIDKLDELLVSWFKENLNEENVNLLKASGSQYPFRNTLLPRKQRDDFHLYLKETSRYKIQFLGEDEVL